MNNNKLDSPLALIFKTNLSDVVEHLIEHNINLTDYVIFDSSGTYPLLCFLAYKNDFHTFQSLLEKDMIPKISLFFKDSANLSPVCYFIMQGNKKAVEYCIKEMIACDYQVFERHASELILYCAKHDETGKLTRIILDQIIVNQLVIKPAIEEALLYEKYKSLREMFKSHRNDFSTNQINGLMSLAMKHKDWEFCENLISNISTDYKDEHGNNFLHLAATYNATPEIIRVLKDRGVEYLRNEYNQKQYATPLKMALENKNLYTLIAIMTIYDRKISNEFANQSLCLAIKNGNLNDVKFFSPLVTPNFKDRNGDTALHHAAIKYNQSNQSEQHLEIYKYLLECGYKEDIKNHNGKTPHWLANYRGDMLFSSKILEQTTNKSGHSR